MPDVLEGAVIGAGTIGERHARLLAEHPGTNLRAVIDLDEDRARTVGREHGADVASSDAADTLAAEPIDLAIVATPESNHLASTELALDHGCHVLLEKPIAATEADARRIGELAAASEQALMIAYCCRFDPEYAGLKARIDDGEFGEILGVQAARIGSAESYASVADWTHTVYYLAVHDIDMLCWYLDGEVEEVHAYASDGLGDLDTPAVISTTVTFESGTVGSLETNWARPSGHPLELTQEVRITGTDGYARSVIQDDGIPISTDEGFRYAPSTDLHGRQTDMYRFQLEAFLETIRTGEEPPVTWEDGLRSLRVANAIRESIDRGTPVSL